MTKRTALASATKRPVDPDAWVAEAAEKTAPTGAKAAEKPARLVVEIPPDMHRRLKIKCASEGMKIKDVVHDLLERYLAE